MQTTPMWKTSVSIVLINALVALILASCASYHYEVITPPDNRFQIEPGDTVRIVTKDGQDLEFKILTISSEAMAGEGRRVLFSEIATLEKRVRESASTGVWWMLNIAGAVLLCLLVICLY